MVHREVVKKYPEMSIMLCYILTFNQGAMHSSEFQCKLTPEKEVRTSLDPRLPQIFNVACNIENLREPGDEARYVPPLVLVWSNKKLLVSNFVLT